MALLLDTHALLFWFAGGTKLSEKARLAIKDQAGPVFVSAASGWEIATKFRIGKLSFAGDPQIHVPRLMARNGFRFAPVTGEHGVRAGALEGAHRDPFDRLIAAQALIDDLTVITRDREIAAFGCKVLW